MKKPSSSNYGMSTWCSFFKTTDFTIFVMARNINMYCQKIYLEELRYSKAITNMLNIMHKNHMQDM